MRLLKPISAEYNYSLAKPEKDKWIPLASSWRQMFDLLESSVRTTLFAYGFAPCSRWNVERLANTSQRSRYSRAPVFRAFLFEQLLIKA